MNAQQALTLAFAPLFFMFGEEKTIAAIEAYRDHLVASGRQHFSLNEAVDWVMDRLIDELMGEDF
jgi:hypothetical protein